MKPLIAGVVLGFCACSGLPPRGKPALPDVEFRIRDLRLRNGMRILVEEERGSPLVGVFTCVGVGSAADPPGREGLAHLVEHLLFRNKADGRVTMWDRLENAGVGVENAFTDFNTTVYFEVGSRDILGQLLQIEGERMAAPLAGVDEETFAVEKEVVRNELRQRGENQIGPALPWLQEAVFPPGSSWSRPVGGSHASISAITLDDARRFVAEHYQPAKMTMLIVGDVDLASIHEVLANTLPMSLFQPGGARTPFPSRIPAEVKEPPPPPPPPAVLAKHRATVPTPELYLVWSLPRGFDEEGVVQDFVTEAAGGAMQEAWWEDGDIVSVDVSTFAGVDASMLIARAVLRTAGHPERSMEHLLNQMVQLWTLGEAGREWAPSGREEMVQTSVRFGQHRSNAVVRMALEAENIAARGTQRVVAAHFTGDPLMYGRRMRALAQLGHGQVTGFAEKYLRRDRARAVLVEPFPENAKESVSARVGLGAEVSVEPNPAIISADAVRALGRSRTSATETAANGARMRADEVLPNGLHVVVRRRRGLPVAVVHLAFPVGGATGSPRGVAELADMLASTRFRRYGTGADYGIQWSRGTGADSMWVTGRGAAGNLPNMLAQLSDRLDSTSVDSSAITPFRREYLDYFERIEHLPQEKADRALRAGLFGNHPFGQTASSAELKEISASDINGWLNRVHSPRGAVLVIAGDVDVDASLLATRKWLGDWSGPSKPIAPVPVVALKQSPRPLVQIHHRPGATQAELRIECLAPGGSSRQELANGMLAQLFASRAFRKLRGELGATYGIHGSASTLVGGTGHLRWSGELENSRLASALVELRRVWEGLEAQLGDEKVFGQARWQEARAATLQTLTSEAEATTLADLLLLGRSGDQLDKIFEELAQMSVDDVRAAWRQCRAHAVVSLVGDETTVKAASTSAGF